MASNVEIRIVQNNSLFGLLLLRAENQKAGIKVKGLSRLVTQVKATMTKEDIAWVEQQIAALEDDEV